MFREENIFTIIVIYEIHVSKDEYLLLLDGLTYFKYSMHLCLALTLTLKQIKKKKIIYSSIID